MCRVKIWKILSQIRQQVSQRRIDVKPAFKMNDKTNRGTVTETQFLSRQPISTIPKIEAIAIFSSRHSGFKSRPERDPLRKILHAC